MSVRVYCDRCKKRAAGDINVMTASVRKWIGDWQVKLSIVRSPLDAGGKADQCICAACALEIITSGELNDSRLARIKAKHEADLESGTDG